MSLWVKVCGLTDARSVDAALDAGVDAIGFVFAPSPREISVGAARALKKRIGAAAATVAVMRHPLKAVATRILDELRPDVFQTDLQDLQGIAVPDGVKVLPVLRAGRVDGFGTLPARALFEGADSGTGEVTDWDEAYDLARRVEIVLAGGLSPDNVAAAVAHVRPFGVDVSSGVESRPGVKDADRIAAFVRAARAAADKISDDEDQTA